MLSEKCGVLLDGVELLPAAFQRVSRGATGNVGGGSPMPFHHIGPPLLEDGEPQEIFDQGPTICSP